MNETTESYRAALTWATGWCARAEHCLSEVSARLEKYDLSGSETESLLARLTKEGYVDEERYARSYASDQFRFSRWGRLKIRQALRRKQVADACIEAALSDIPQEEYLSVLQALVSDKYARTSAGSEYERAAKVMRFACSRGFEPEYVRRCLPYSID